MTFAITGAVYEAGTVTDVSGVLSGTGIPSVRLTIAGVEVGTSNDQGFYDAELSSVGVEASVCFSAEGYVTRCRNLILDAAEAVRVSPTELMPSRPAVVLPNAVGTAGQGNATAVIGAGAICKADRTTAVTGAISCSVSPISAAVPAEREWAPGSYVGRTTGGELAQLVTGGMVDITCVEVATGQEVDVCTGKSVTARIPITADCSSDSLYPNPMASWGFNETTGLWEEESSFAKTCTSAAEGYYEGVATHFSFWNADMVIETTCATGKVVRADGTGISGARVQCQGTSYQGSSETYTGADGSFCAALMRGGSATCTAEKGGFRSQFPVSVTMQNVTATCGGSCQGIGTLTLADSTLQSVLTWTQLPSDLDAHWVPQDFVSRPADWISFFNRGSLLETPFAALNTDDTQSFGPEVMTVMPQVTPGRYRYCVHNFSEDVLLTASAAKVRVDSKGFQKTYSVPTSTSNGNVWRVYEVQVGANGDKTFTDLNTLGSAVLTGESMDSVAQACWAQ